MEPLIITLSIDDGSQQFFNALRKQHFPPERNFLSAHLTLFHALPHELLADVDKSLNRMAAETTKFLMQVTGIRNLGKGVAYNINSEELMKIHVAMQQEWIKHLIPQDKQKLNPHITVQNKVTSAEASTLYNELNSQDFPTNIMAVGFTLWKYIGGPWEKVSSYTFTNTV